MNVMTFAHAMTRRNFARLNGASIHYTYKELFRSALIDAHRIARREGFEALTRRVTECKQIDQRIANEKMIVRKVVKNAIALGYLVSLHDGEEWTVRATSQVSEVMNAIQTTDADTLRFRKMNAQGEYGSIGQVYCVYGNSASEVIADYSDTAEMEMILKPAMERADKLSAVGL